MFVRMYLKEINEIYNDGEDEQNALNIVVKKHIGCNLSVCSLGHDALESRHSDMQVLDGTENMNQFKIIKKWIKLEENIKDELPINSLHCGDLMFIGQYESIGDAEFSYRVKAPEIIYGLPALIPCLIKCYNKYKDMDCIALERFNQKPCIWTFAPDCACCG